MEGALCVAATDRGFADTPVADEEDLGDEVVFIEVVRLHRDRLRVSIIIVSVD